MLANPLGWMKLLFKLTIFTYNLLEVHFQFFSARSIRDKVICVLLMPIESGII